MSLYLSSGNISWPSQRSHSTGALTYAPYTTSRHRATRAQGCCLGDGCDIARGIQQGPAQLPVPAISCHTLNTTHILAGEPKVLLFAYCSYWECPSPTHVFRKPFSPCKVLRFLLPTECAQQLVGLSYDALGRSTAWGWRHQRSVYFSCHRTALPLVACDPRAHPLGTPEFRMHHDALLAGRLRFTQALENESHKEATKAAFVSFGVEVFKHFLLFNYFNMCLYTVFVY